MRRVAGVVVGAAVVVSACGDSSDGAAQVETTVATATTVVASTTTLPDATTTTTAVVTTTEMSVTTETTATSDVTATTDSNGGMAEGVDVSASVIASTWGRSGPFYDNGGTLPDGSGCSPGSDELPDGVWYVRLAAIAEGTVDVDLMCVYSDEAAFSRDDYGGGDRLYINESERLRTVALAADPKIFLIADWNNPESQQQVPLTVLETAVDEGPSDGWLLVEGGVAVEFWQPWDS